jgi:hypothetical protein
VAWVFFRAADVGTAFHVVRSMVVPRGPLFVDPILVQGFVGTAAVFALERFHRRADLWENLGRYPAAFRVGYALALLMAVVLLGVDGGGQFIYFQF